MTELEVLMEQKKEIERKIRELRMKEETYGIDGIVKCERKRWGTSREFYRVCAKRMSYNDVSDMKYMSLVEVDVERKKEAVEHIRKIRDGLNFYLMSLSEKE